MQFKIIQWEEINFEKNNNKIESILVYSFILADNFEKIGLIRVFRSHLNCLNLTIDKLSCQYNNDISFLFFFLI